MKSCQILFGVLALCASAFASAADVKTVRPTSSNCECEEVLASFCTDHYGADSWYARFPNARDQQYTEALGEFLDFYRAGLLSLDNYCSHMLHNLLCFHYFPKCEPNRPRLGAIPCQETCNEAQAACIQHARAKRPNFVFPAHLNCSNFPSGSRDCDLVLGEEAGCTAHCSACPNASVHLEFATKVGQTNFSGSEGDGSVSVCLKLANVGSYDPEATLQEDTTVTLTTAPMRFYAQAEAERDYVPLLLREVVFPAGCAKGSVICIEIEIVSDNIDETKEYFKVIANVTSPSDAKFGGAANRATGSILVEIKNTDPRPTPTSSPTPTPPEPFIPANTECNNRGCNWRTSISKNTFKKNDYTFVALVEVVECSDSVMVVNMRECHNTTSCERCPLTSNIAICSNCRGSCPTGENIIAGGHTDIGTLYIHNTKKKGLVAPVRSGWDDFLPTCAK